MSSAVTLPRDLLGNLLDIAVIRVDVLHTRLTAAVAAGDNAGAIRVYRDEYEAARVVFDECRAHLYDL